MSPRRRPAAFAGACPASFRAPKPLALLALALALAAPASAQVGGPVGSPVGGGVGGPIGAVTVPLNVTQAVSGAVGGTPPAAPPIDDEDFDAGIPINTGRGVEFGAGLIAEYGSNLLRLPPSQPLPQRLRSRSDFRVRPSVTARLGQPFGRQQLFLSGFYGRDFYARNTALNRGRYQIDGGVMYRVGTRCGGVLRGGLNSRQTSVDEFAVVQDSVRKLVNADFSAQCQSPVGFSPSLNLGYFKVTNSLATRQRLNADGVTAQLGVNYPLAGRGQIGLGATYGRTKFPNVPVLGGGDYALTNYGGLLSASYKIGVALQASGTIGYTFTKSPGSRRYGSPIFTGTLAYSGPRLSASLTASRAIIPARGGEAAFFVADRYGFDVGYSAAGDLNLYTGVQRARRDFVGEILLPSPIVRRAITTDRVYVGVKRPLGRFLTTGLEAYHLRRTANPSIFNATDTGLRLSLNANF